MTARLRPCGDPRIRALLRVLPALDIPVRPADHARLALVFPPERELDWLETRELLAALLAKDEHERNTLRAQFGRLVPLSAEDSAADDPWPRDGAAAPRQPVEHPPNPPLGTAARRVPGRRPLVLAVAVGLTLALALALVAVQGPLRAPVAPSAPVRASAAPPLPLADPGPAPSPLAPPGQPGRADPRPPLALLLGSLAALAWIGWRTWNLLDPRVRPAPLNPAGQPDFYWSHAQRRLPPLLDERARRDMIWGVQRFEDDRRLSRLDVPATVAASARAGVPAPRFARASREREVWLWLDTHLESRAALALARETERDLRRAGLAVRVAYFAGLPVRIHFTAGETADARDLEGDARHALVVLFSDGRRLLQDQTDGAFRERTRGLLRLLAGWPRLCLVDCSQDARALTALARDHGLTRIAPPQLPAWLAEQPPRDPAPAVPRDGADPHLEVLWRAFCALPERALARTQASALHRIAGLPPTWQVPNPSGLDDNGELIRFTPAERESLLARLADWAWRDRSVSRRLAEALQYWDAQLRRAEQDIRAVPELQDGAWEESPGQRRLQIERALLALWRGGAAADRAARRLWDLARPGHPRPRPEGHAASNWERDDLHKLVRARLAELSARDLAPARPGAGRIVLPWAWQAPPWQPRSVAGDTRRRLIRMGFAGAGPVELIPPTRLAAIVGILLGLALAALAGIFSGA